MNNKHSHTIVRVYNTHTRATAHSFTHWRAHTYADGTISDV